MNNEFFLCVSEPMFEAAPRRTTIDVGRGRWKHGRGRAADVLPVSRHVSGQNQRHQASDPRTGPHTVPGLLGAEGSGAAGGGEPVLQQIPGQDPEAAQVRDPKVHQKNLLF